MHLFKPAAAWLAVALSLAIPGIALDGSGVAILLGVIATGALACSGFYFYLWFMWLMSKG